MQRRGVVIINNTRPSNEILYAFVEGTSRWPPLWEIAVHLAVTGDVFDGVFLCGPFSNEMSWM